MALKVYIRQNPGTTNNDEDFTDVVPIFAGNEPQLRAGMQWSDGDASAATFVVDDPDGNTVGGGTDHEMAGHNLVTVTEDTSGCELWLHRGRLSGIDGGRGLQKADSKVEYSLTSDDGNVDLKGQSFAEDWVRPSETDYARIVALQAYTLNGTSSTATHHRDTCFVVAIDSHRCKNANTVTMPAKTYPIGTQPVEVIDDCAQMSGKLYGVTIHHGPPPGGLVAYEHITFEGGGDIHWAHGGGLVAASDDVITLGAGSGALGTDWFNLKDHDAGFIDPLPWAVGQSGHVVEYINQRVDDDSPKSIVLQYLDSVSSLISSEIVFDDTSPEPGVWREVQFDIGAAPPNTVSVNWIHMTGSGGTGVGTTFAFDELTVTATSEGDDCSHLCLQYIVPGDGTTNVSTVKISDQVADWDPDNLTAPVFEPIWDSGKATLYDTQEMISALVSRYGVDTSAAVFVESTGDSDVYDYWADSYDDSESVNPTQAAARASALLAARILTHVTHQVSVLVRADQIPLFEGGAGTLIQIKAAAALSAQYLGTWQSRRVAECIWEPVSPELGHRLTGSLVPLYWAHLNLDRPPRRARLSAGQVQSVATTPHTATDMPYTPPGGGSPLTATDVQDAIDQLQAEIDALPAAGDFVTTTEGGGEVVQNHGALGATETFDLANGNIHTGTLDADCTFTFTGYSASGDGISFALFLTQDGTGGWTVTWPAEVANAADINTAIDTTAGGLQIVVFTSADDGTTVYGFVTGSGGGTSVTFGTPALTFGTSNTAGATDEVIRRDAGLAIFDTTVPVTQAFSDSAATGSAAFAARRDHVHGMPADPGGATAGQLLIADSHSTPLVFADLIQNEAQDDLVYAD